MAEILPLPSDGVAIIEGQWSHNPIVEILPRPSGGVAIIEGLDASTGLFLGRPFTSSQPKGLVRS